jgi:hypothetical protein
VRKIVRFFHNRHVFHFFGFAALWTLIVLTSFLIYLWVRELSEIKSTTGTLFGDAFGAIVVISMMAIIANYLGMWVYLFACDNSGWGKKSHLDRHYLLYGAHCNNHLFLLCLQGPVFCIEIAS